MKHRNKYLFLQGKKVINMFGQSPIHIYNE